MWTGCKVGVSAAYNNSGAVMGFPTRLLEFRGKRRQRSSLRRQARGDFMRKLLSTVSLFLMSCWAYAASKEIEGANAPVETVDMIYVVLFAVLFLGLIVGFFVWMWLANRKKNPD
jgi:hypothetical protein